MVDTATSTRRMIMFGCAFALSSVSVGVLIYGLVHSELNPNTLTNALFVSTACSWILFSIDSRFDSSSRQIEQVERYLLDRLQQVEREIRADMVVTSRNDRRIVRPVD